MSQTYSAPTKARSGCMWAFMIMMMVLVGGAAVVGGGTAWLFNGLAKSEGAMQALKRVADAPAVIAKLGTPVTRGMFANGSYAINTNGTGSVDLALPVSGPNGSGKLLIVGTRSNHQWSYSRLVVVPADGSAEISVK
jgi:Cytochrome oxidase complex assembly protein 1